MNSLTSPAMGAGDGDDGAPAKRRRQDALVATLAQGILAGQRRALAQGITLVESTRRDHREKAEALLARLLPETGRSVRLGISGVPGVGKSTFIEAFGLSAIGQGHKVAVLAIDPSSRRTGGSILGDKTRMEQLARNDAAFIRPSPSAGSLGGVARRTREVMLLCEAAGFDVVVIETVGVGQSETAVADMVDLFALLLLPSGGDELQGIKKGIVELAEYQSALRMLRPLNDAWQVPVLQVSALHDSGLDEVWKAVWRYREALGETGLATKRAEQAKAWMWHEIEEELLRAFREEKQVATALKTLEAEVMSGRNSAAAAAKELLKRFFGR